MTELFIMCYLATSKKKDPDRWLLSACIFGSEDGDNILLRDINELLLDYKAAQSITEQGYST